MPAEPTPTSAPPAPRGLRVWWAAVRPRTLTIAITPVLLGTALAWAEGAPIHALAALAALACAVLIQMATNLFNDVADFERGCDRADRVGPLRVSAAGWARPAEVRRAAFIALALAIALGLYLVLLGGWVILAVGLASIAAGWAYSNGPHPVSHTPLGELFVWVFFGIVAVAGSHYLQSGGVSIAALIAGAAVGSHAAAVLVVNNHRDRATDLAAGRRTLAAALGTRATQRLYAAMMLVPLLAPIGLAATGPARPWALLGLLVLPACIRLIARFGQASGGELNAVLAATALTQLVFGLLLSIGLVV